MVGRQKKKERERESAEIAKSSSFSYKKLLKPSLLSGPKTTALDYAFIISYLKPALSPIFCSVPLLSLSSLFSVLSPGDFHSKIQRYRILLHF